MKLPHRAALTVAAGVVVMCLACLALMRFRTVVYVCRRVVGHSNATAVAVRGGRIISVGRTEDLRHHGRLDMSLAAKYVMPGLIDPRCSVILSSAILGLDSIIAPEPWMLPHASFPAARSPAEYTAILTAHMSLDRPFLLSFGYYPPLHGPLTKQSLDDLTPVLPVAVWMRCGTALVLNSAAIDALGLSDTSENGLIQGPALRHMCARLFAAVGMKERMEAGVRRLQTYLTGQGITTIGDVACSPREILWVRSRLANAPLTVRFVARPYTEVSRYGFKLGTMKLQQDRELSQDPSGSSNVDWATGENVMLQLDGSITAQAHQKKFNHATGVWVFSQGGCDNVCRWFAHRKARLSYEVHGDFALEIVLGHLHKRQYEGVMLRQPCVFLNHCSDVKDVSSKIKKIHGGVGLSTSPHMAWAGYGEAVAPLGSLHKAGHPCAIHSSMPFGAPSDPLGQAAMASWWRHDPAERVSRAQGLACITSLAAEAMHMGRSVGSVTPAKSFWADFCVLDNDPYRAEEPRVWGVVHRGRIVEAGTWSRRALGGPLSHPPQEPHADPVPLRRFSTGSESCPVHGILHELTRLLS